MLNVLITTKKYKGHMKQVQQSQGKRLPVLLKMCLALREPNMQKSETTK